MPELSFSHVALSCADPLKIEQFYTQHFGFHRSRVYAPGKDQVVMLKSDGVYLELFPSTRPRPSERVGGAGPDYPSVRHIAFLVDNLDAKLAEIGPDVRLSLGPLDMGKFIPGMRVAWLFDPEDNIVELNQGYVDEANPPARA